MPRRRPHKPTLKIEHILAWADDYHDHTGKWPTAYSGRVRAATDTTWNAVDQALRYGRRGFPGGQSLPNLLRERRGKRHHLMLPPLRKGQILAWADAHHRRTGRWPTGRSGPVHEAPHEIWGRIDKSLTYGFRGLPGGESLAILLVQQRGIYSQPYATSLSIREILRWAEAHRRQTGQWPTVKSGKVAGADRESWQGINDALADGRRDLPGGSSLARLLLNHQGKRHPDDAPRLTIRQILAWADAHRRRTGQWPTSKTASPVPGAPYENWTGLDHALRKGTRGLPACGGLPWILTKHRGVWSRATQPPLSHEKILAWADAHHRRTAHWPNRDSGRLDGVDNENWQKIDQALHSGARCLPGGETLADLLMVRRGVRHPRKLPPLGTGRILEWADSFRRRTGRWPTAKSGDIPEAPGESWAKVEHALKDGVRGQPGGSSLAQLLERRRGKRNRSHPPGLSESQILAWADEHKRRTGEWPRVASGHVRGAPEEVWANINSALWGGGRGLPRGSSLANLLTKARGVPNVNQPPKLRVTQILRWADAFHERTGRWPAAASGAVAEAPDENWAAIDQTLRKGQRSLPAGLSITRLLARHRGARNIRALPRLTEKRIMSWARHHRRRTRLWPTQDSGPIREAPGESWPGVNAALVRGTRGLPPGVNSLSRLIERHAGIA